MKYSVDVKGTRLILEAIGDRIKLGGEDLHASLNPAGANGVAVLRLGDRVHRVAFSRKGAAGEGGEPARRGQYTIWVDGERFEVDALDQRRRAIEESTAAVRTRGAADLKAPMPGLIVKVRVADGDSVTAGQGLIVMEAMKMENELRAPSAGVVRKIHVAPGKAVEKGSLLIELE
jgi:biotin carboxyl carrier protein